MSELSDFFNAADTVFLATVAEDGGARVRPFAYYHEDAGKIWWLTTRTKTVWDELYGGKIVEICAMVGDRWVRMRGVPQFEKDATVVKTQKTKALQKSPGLDQLYQADGGVVASSNVMVFYLKNPKATLYSFTEAPKKLI